ncbi:MAG: hypothetical protein Q4G16_08140 [Cruoricaptor ignavus]|nr:hypothetical protein [Cruoricaptor ignavus]
MKINRSFIIVFTIIFAIYFPPELLFDDAMLYIVGGIIGALLQEVLKIFVRSPSNYLVLILWGIILLGFIGLFFWTKRKYLKYVLALIIGLLLYIIDFIYAAILVYGIQKAGFMDSLFSIIVIFCKTLILSFILYHGYIKKSK